MTLREAWEAAAEAWSDYVRAGRDPFFRVNLAAFVELLPPPRGTTLDIGCGEGRVGAELEARGHRVLGVEQSPTLAALARERHEVVEADEDAGFRLDALREPADPGDDAQLKRVPHFLHLLAVKP